MAANNNKQADSADKKDAGGIEEIQALETKVLNLEENLKTAEARLKAAETKLQEAESKLKTSEISDLPKNFKGFVIAFKDPYADGVRRFLAKTFKIEGLNGNLNIRYESKYARAALENYIVRAGGAGDTSRVKWATEELTKVRKDN